MSKAIAGAKESALRAMREGTALASNKKAISELREKIEADTRLVKTITKGKKKGTKKKPKPKGY